MHVLHTIAECRKALASCGPIGFVPTMGALHAGHLSLVKAARDRGLTPVVSIFVNPTQFGPKEDFTRYPRPIEADLAMCGDAGVAAVFNPEPGEMYPPGSPAMSIAMPGLTDTLEGASRPGHFSGVCQVVLKLFNIVQPRQAFFGMKDYQQLTVLSRLTRALDLDIEIVPCPTLRDADGLAMSSRNRYLSATERQQALSISASLRWAIQDASAMADEAIERECALRITQAGLVVDYVAIRDAVTLSAPASGTPRVILAAARCGSTRLIDNMLFPALPR